LNINADSLAEQQATANEVLSAEEMEEVSAGIFFNGNAYLKRINLMDIGGRIKTAGSPWGCY
ncbi:MAG: hypothetical protein VX543_03720, partial [Cyanobacteriota bacterium]|nr:hypothetical protein [Cyanobacteriota bacterium]